MATDLEIQFQKKLEGDEAARLYRNNAEALVPRIPTPEEEAIKDLPLGGVTEPVVAGVEELGSKATEAAGAAQGPLDAFGKALGLDLPKGGLGKALEGVLGTPSPEMTPGEAGVATLAAGAPVLGPISKVGSKVTMGVSKDIQGLRELATKRSLSAFANDSVVRTKLMMELGESAESFWEANHKASPKMLRLEHYSNVRGLKSLDPSHAGEGQGGAELKLGGPPKSFAYVEGAKIEPRFKGSKYKYQVEVPEDRIAQGKVYEEFQKKYINPLERENAIKEAGYLGYRDKEMGETWGDVVALFEPTTPVHIPLVLKPLAGKEARKLAEDAASELYASGGSTHSLGHGNLRGTNAYAVAVQPELRGYAPGNASKEEIQKWIEGVSKKANLEDNMTALGTWFDKENNRTEMSVSLLFTDQEEALAFARETGERAIYSLGSGHEIFVGNPRNTGQAGKIDVQASLALAGALAGGAYGWNASEPDEKWANTLKDAGLGLLAPYALPLARAIYRSKMETAVPGNASALTAAERVSPLADIAKAYREAVARYQRGVITHAQSRATGAAKIAAGHISDEWIATRHPGSTYNEAQTAAYKEYLLQEGEKLRALATNYNFHPNNKPLEEEFLRQLAVYAKMDPLDVGLEAEAGRTMSYLNDVENEVNTFVRQMSGVVGKVRVTQSSKRMAEMIAATRSVESLADFARTITAPGLGDMLIESWINGLLSQPITHVTNSVSNMVTLATSIPERALAAGFGREGAGGVVNGEATAMWRGFYQSAGDAWVTAAKAFREDRPAFGAEKMEVRKHSITATNANLALQRAGLDPLEGSWVKGIDYLGVAARIPGRLLMASDEFFKGIAFNMERSALSWRHASQEAVAEGHTGKALRQRITERHTEIMNDPHQWEAFRHDAEQFASYVTFTKELGEAGQALQHITSIHPFAKFITPFIRTPINIAKYAGERTPFALASKAVRDDIAAGGAKRDLALAKIGAGSTAMAMMGVLAYAGVVTGFGPSDRESRRMWQTDGRKPYSINVTALKRMAAGGDSSPHTGDVWLGYSRTDPVGMLVGLAADYTDIVTHTDDPEVADHLGSRLTLVASHVIASKTYVKGISEWLFAAVDPEHYGGKLEESLARTVVTTVPVLGPAAKFVQRAIDPVVRETNGVMESIRASIPGLSSTLSPRINYWGEVQMREGWMAEQVLSPLYHSTHIKDTVVEKLVEARVNLTQPKDTIGTYKLTGPQNEYLLRRFGDVALGGRTLHDEYERILDKLWDRTLPGLRRDPQSLLHLTLKRAEDAYKQAARNALYKEFDEVRKAAGEDITDKIEARKLTPSGSNIRIQ